MKKTELHLSELMHTPTAQTHEHISPMSADQQYYSKVCVAVINIIVLFVINKPKELLESNNL